MLNVAGSRDVKFCSRHRGPHCHFLRTEHCFDGQGPSDGEEQTLLEVECGGAHRSWDLHVCRARGWLVCAFLKDGLPYTFSTSITDKLLPLIRQRGETVFVTGGEDTTLRLHALQHKGQRQTLGVQRSHLSGVRALCLVEGTNSTQSDDGSGGVQSSRLWQCSVKECPDLARNSTCDSCFCELCAHSQGFKHSMESDSSSFRLPNVTFREVGSHMLRTGCQRPGRANT
ncbi:hypothetical protein GWK47_042190 [Chionoecetes opilio]|uniref:Uncharacterized protein n=1 Tax=Chionoecetes opilio TaxID=41210 RepID=A0A8J4YAI2_CHIOP|nr:hypothetical protein GWK47_042190 [Chionoecetes opilio]